MTYEFSAIMTLDDYIQFNKMFHRKSNILMLIPLAAWVLFYLFIDIKGIEYIYFFILFVLIFILIISKIFFRVNYKKSYYSTKFLQDDCFFKISEKSIEITTQDSRAIAKRDKIHKIKFDKDSIYLFIAVNMAYIIKKRYLKSGDEFNELKEFVKKHYLPNSQV
ncbi:MAG: YcxB family protein [Campylobacteraceae bacterium]|jgi:hypothetical protein|nr:YcxB family protein [Campylobacteraceae bacterium]